MYYKEVPTLATQFYFLEYIKKAQSSQWNKVVALGQVQQNNRENNKERICKVKFWLQSW